MLSLGHCCQILANEKQESIATISMKKKKKKKICSELIVPVRSLIPLQSFSFSQSLVLGWSALAVSC